MLDKAYTCFNCLRNSNNNNNSNTNNYTSNNSYSNNNNNFNSNNFSNVISNKTIESKLQNNHLKNKSKVYAILDLRISEIENNNSNIINSKNSNKTNHTSTLDLKPGFLPMTVILDQDDLLSDNVKLIN